MKIFIVIVRDDRSDTDAVPFFDAQNAIAYAKGMVAVLSSNRGAENEYLSEGMISQGWIYYASYRCGDSNIYVMEREVL